MSPSNTPLNSSGAVPSSCSSCTRASHIFFNMS
jgi:hypothetical protein